MAKVVHREVNGFERNFSFLGIYPGSSITRIDVKFGGKNYGLLVIDEDYRWLLERMRRKQLKAFIREEDYCGWTPHPADVFCQWGIAYEYYSDEDVPGMLETRDILVFKDSRGSASMFRVLEPQTSD